MSGWGTSRLHRSYLPKIEQSVAQLLHNVVVTIGACVGIDALVARLAKSRNLSVYTIVPWDKRQIDPSWKDYCDTYELMPEGTDFRA